MYRIVLKPAALSMMREAYIWYEGKQHGLGEKFLSSLDKIFNKLSTHPQ